MNIIKNILDCEKYVQAYEAVIFDLDDTLYSEKDYVKSGFDLIGREFCQVDGMAEKLWRVFKKKGKPIDEVLLNEGLYSNENKNKCLEIYRNQKPSIYLYLGVKELLQRLYNHKKLGIITDGRPEGQRAKIESLGLNNLVDEIIITDEFGGSQFRKPNDKAFRLMCKKLNVSFEKAVYIGDNIKKDFIAPQKLGMGYIYFKNSEGLYSEND